MPSFRRRDAVSGTDSADATSSAALASADQARALAEEAEAEAAEAEATAAAARARARALRLRREAEQAVDNEQQGDHPDPQAVDPAPVDVKANGGADPPGDDGDIGEDTDGTDDPAVESRRHRVPRPTWKGIAAALVVVCTTALVAASGYMMWSHRQAEELRQQNAEFAAAARQGVVTLMSLDFNTAQESVQRIIDNSTGQFKVDFEQQAVDFVTVAQDSEVVTDVTVNSTAVETMTEDSAVVLVAAASRVTNASGANQEPRTWRLSVGLQREDGQIKMSKVEFVP